MHQDRISEQSNSAINLLAAYNQYINSDVKLDFLPQEAQEKMAQLLPAAELVSLSAIYASLLDPLDSNMNQFNAGPNPPLNHQLLPRIPRIIKKELINALSGQVDPIQLEQLKQIEEKNINSFILNRSTNPTDQQGILRDIEIKEVFEELKSYTLKNWWENNIQTNGQNKLDPLLIFQQTWQRMHKTIAAKIQKRIFDEESSRISRLRALFFKFLHERNHQKQLRPGELEIIKRENAKDQLLLETLEQSRITTLSEQLNRHEQYRHQVSQVFPELSEKSLAGAVLAQRLDLAQNISEIFILSIILPPWIKSSKYGVLIRLLKTHFPNIEKDKLLPNISPENKNYYSKDEYINLYLGIIKLLTADSNIPIDPRSPLGRLWGEINTFLSFDLVEQANNPKKIQILDDFREALRSKSLPTHRGLNNLEQLTQHIYQHPNPPLNANFLRSDYLQIMFPEIKLHN